MKKLTYLTLLTISFLITSCGNGNKEMDASGVFEATEVIVSAEASGKILRFDVQQGALIKADQIVGYIDTTQLYLKKMQIMANVKSMTSRKLNIEKQIAGTKQQILTAQKETERFNKLLGSNAATQKQVDDINSQIALLEKQLDAQSSTMENSNRSIEEDKSALQIQIEQIDDQLKKSKIITPIDGTVLVKYAELGELTSYGKALFKIADISNMFLRAYITSSQLSQIKNGQTVKVYSDFGEDNSREYSGKVVWISDKSEFTPKTVQTKDERANLVYAIKIAIKNDGYLKTGMYGELKFGEE
ncbi:MAG: HlyD family efflux transporter periplasmic adaptor subunit [Ignavibacteria bacterium]|nr:HlyD family efflux transporter periplasmic adaptor subunit [Ignavibacteria bacterium]